MKIGVRISFQISVFVFGKYPEVELLGHVVDLFFSFFRNLHTVFHSDHTKSSPTNSA